MLIAVSCQKEKMPEQQAQNSAVTESTAMAAQLASDPNFVKLYNISKPVFNSLQHGRNDLTELINDGKIKYKECKTLARKLGFTDSAALVNYIHEVNVLAHKIAKSHPNAQLRQYQEASSKMNETNLMATPCQDAAEGAFIMNVAQCSALALIPVAGEVLAGTCMVGALMSYNASMEACAGAS